MNIENSEIIESVEKITSTLNTIFCEAKDGFAEILNNDHIIATAFTINEISQGLSDAITYIEFIRKVASIPTKLFMNKFERYTKGIIDIPHSKRQRYLKKIGKPGLNKDFVFILNVLNKIEELSKIDILLALLEAKMDDILDDASYRRLTIMVDRTLYSDLHYLNEHIITGYLKITCSEEEALLSSGFLLFAGIGVGGFDETGSTEDGGNLYRYTNAAKQLCKIAFKRDEVPQGIYKGGVFVIQTTSNDETDLLLTGTNEPKS